MVSAFASAALGLPGLVHAAASGPVRVGILQPFSGGLEALGEQGFQGGKLAIDDINAAGGLLGKPVDLFAPTRAQTRKPQSSARRN